MNKKTKRIVICILSVVLIALCGFYALLTTGTISLGKQEQPVVENVTPSDPIAQLDPKYEEYLQVWKDNKQINRDYVGNVFFESGLLDCPFVQAKDVYDPDGNMYKFYTENGNLVEDPSGYTGNDVYIWTNWKTGKYDYNDEGGSTFMEYLNDLSDQNIIIYGHHFSSWNDITRKKAFTPLEQLLEYNNYQDNAKVSLVLENEIREYELWSVYEFDINDPECVEKSQYWRPFYNYDYYSGTQDDNYYDNYIEYVENNRLYPTDVELTNTDKTLTLQTCVSGHTGELFEILVFKQVNVIKTNS